GRSTPAAAASSARWDAWPARSSRSRGWRCGSWCSSPRDSCSAARSFGSTVAQRRAASHSRETGRSPGQPGLLPLLVAVHEGEAAEARLFVALAAAPHDQAHRRADTAGGDEAESERAGRDDRKVRAELAADVGRLAEIVSQRLDGLRELLAFLLDLAPDVVGRPSGCHCSATPQSSASPPRSPAPGGAAILS